MKKFIALGVMSAIMTAPLSGLAFSDISESPHKSEIEFFEKEGIVTDCVVDFNKEYQVRLGDTICFCDDSYNLLKGLKGKIKQYAVTNGTKVAQDKKLKKSGLDELFDDIFISEVIGKEKPYVEYFEQVWKRIGDYKGDEVMIVGDSLTSDMQGGNNAGIFGNRANL